MMSQLCVECAMKQQKAKLSLMLQQHQEVSTKMGKMFLLRHKMELLNLALEELKVRLEQGKNELLVLTRTNEKREERLKRAKRRDLGEKLEQAQHECMKRRGLLETEEFQLMKTRRQFINKMMENIFYIRIELRSDNDAIVTDLQSGSSSDVFKDFEVIDEEFVDKHCISDNKTRAITQGIHLDHIGYGAMPTDCNIIDYIHFDKKRNVGIDEDESELIDPLSDLSRAIPAALSLIIHCTVILSNVLNQPLPHPLILPVALCEYGRADKHSHSVMRFMAKLDDNIMFLCFTQNVDQSMLVVGHTLNNLLRLVQHTELGRTGPFVCYPELLRYPNTKLKKSHLPSTDQHFDWDSEPPLLHSAQSPHETKQIYMEESSESEEEEESDSEAEITRIGDGWEEVQDLMVPAPFLFGPKTVGERLEYGTSYSEYNAQGLYNAQQDTTSSVQVTSGLMDTISSLLGSGWSKK